MTGAYLPIAHLSFILLCPVLDKQSMISTWWYHIYRKIGTRIFLWRHKSSQFYKKFFPEYTNRRSRTLTAAQSCPTGLGWCLFALLLPGRQEAASSGRERPPFFPPTRANFSWTHLRIARSSRFVRLFFAIFLSSPGPRIFLYCHRFSLFYIFIDIFYNKLSI